MARPGFAWTARVDGNIAVDGDVAAGVLPQAPRPWTWAHQVHGAQVVVVDRPGGSCGLEADALITATVGCALMVRTADCCPVVLTGSHAVGVVHAGWQGLRAGVVGQAVAALLSLDPGPLVAHLGPCIRPGCYEFAGPERDEMIAQFGPALAARTTWGTPALDLPAGVRAALEEAGVATVRDDAPCTACDTRWYSYRARRETGRFATVAWLEPA